MQVSDGQSRWSGGSVALAAQLGDQPDINGGLRKRLVHQEATFLRRSTPEYCDRAIAIDRTQTSDSYRESQEVF